MKKIIYEIVFITIIAFLYYLYSSWVDAFKTNELLYKIFSPFKLLILASIFSIFYGAIKTILFYNIKNLKDYKKNLRNNILFEFETTIKFLNNLNENLKLGDTDKLKVNIKDYNSIKYKPIYLNLLIDEVTSRILSNHDYSDLIQSCNLVNENIKAIYNKEKDRMAHKKSESFFELKRVNEYYNINSWFVISFYLSVHNKDVHSHEYEVNKWKITSLYISRFSYFLYPAFICSLILFVCLGFILNAVNIPINKYFYGTFPICVFFISSILFIFNLYLNIKKYSIKIFWWHLSLYMVFILFIFIDMFLNIILSPILKSTNDWYESDLITFLCYLVYIVLSTMLLSYIFTSVLELFEYKSINLVNILFNIVLPVIIFISSTVLNYLSVRDPNTNKLYLINFLVIFIYWVFSLVTSKYIFK